MNKYILTYYLKDDVDSYKRYRAIQAYMQSMNNWCNFIPTSFLFETNQSLNDLKMEISKFLDNDDQFIICQVTENIVSQLDGRKSEWIQNEFI